MKKLVMMMAILACGYAIANSAIESGKAKLASAQAAHAAGIEAKVKEAMGGE
jgi:hypothetical protein